MLVLLVLVVVGVISRRGGGERAWWRRAVKKSPTSPGETSTSGLGNQQLDSVVLLLGTGCRVCAYSHA